MKLAILLAVGVFPTLVWGACESGWYSFRKQKCVRAYDIHLPFEEAKELCEGVHNGHLASIHSAEEQRFLQLFLFKILSFREHVWIGAALNTNLKLQWADGSRFNYSNWAPDQPNMDLLDSVDPNGQCVYMQYVNETADGMQSDQVGKWSTAPCDTGSPLICQKEPDFSADTLTAKVDDELARLSKLVETLKGKLEDDYQVITGELKNMKAQVDSNLTSVSSEVVIFRSQHESDFNFFIEKITHLHLDIDAEHAALNKSILGIVDKLGSPDGSIKDAIENVKVDVSGNHNAVMAEFKELKEKVDTDHAVISSEIESLRSDVNRLKYCNPDHWSHCALYDGRKVFLFPKLTTETKANFATAERICQKYNSTLVSVHSEKESKFLIRWLRDDVRFSSDWVWLGGKKLVSGKLVWVDKSTFDYTNWKQGQPNEQGESCVDLFLPDSKWRDSICIGSTAISSVVCQKPFPLRSLEARR